MKHRLIQLLCSLLLSTLLIGIAAPLHSAAEPTLPLPSEEQAKETVMGRSSPIGCLSDITMISA